MEWTWQVAIEHWYCGVEGFFMWTWRLSKVDLMNRWSACGLSACWSGLGEQISQHGKIGERTIFYKFFDKHGIIDNARVNWWSACGLSARWSGLGEQMKSTWQIRWANNTL
jgi:hypothetical protein